MELNYDDDEYDPTEWDAMETDDAAFEAHATTNNIHALPGALQQFQDRRVEELHEKLEKPAEPDKQLPQATSAAGGNLDGSARRGITAKERHAASLAASKANKKRVIEQAQLARLQASAQRQADEEARQWQRLKHEAAMSPAERKLHCEKVEAEKFARAERAVHREAALYRGLEAKDLSRKQRNKLIADEKESAAAAGERPLSKNQRKWLQKKKKKAQEAEKQNGLEDSEMADPLPVPDASGGAVGAAAGNEPLSKRQKKQLRKKKAEQQAEKRMNSLATPKEPLTRGQRKRLRKEKIAQQAAKRQNALAVSGAVDPLSTPNVFGDAIGAPGGSNQQSATESFTLPYRPSSNHGALSNQQPLPQFESLVFRMESEQ